MAGVISAARTIGPALGSILGTFCLSFYVIPGNHSVRIKNNKILRGKLNSVKLHSSSLFCKLNRKEASCKYLIL